MMRMAGKAMRLALAAGCAVALLGPAGFGGPAGIGAVQAQDLYAPVAKVNGFVVTRYELEQRIAFMKVLRQSGDLQNLALQGLISDRLQQDAAKALGVTVSDADLQAGLAEFAGRAKLSTDDFVKAIAEGGVEPQTFRDFVKSGLLWRGVLRAKFGGKITISQAEIDRAIAQGAASGGGLRVQLLEIVLPEDGKNDNDLIAGRIQAKVKSAADFAQQAKLFSKAGTAAGGGSLGWVDVAALPPDVAAAISGLKPGEMTPPLHQAGALALYFLQDESEGPAATRGATEVDYALFQPTGAADLKSLQATLTACDQLNLPARGMPAEALQRQTVAEAAVPASLRASLSTLDPGESAVVTGPGGAPALLMLCARQPHAAVPPSRDDVRTQLINRKVTLLATAYLEELRSQAIIITE